MVEGRRHADCSLVCSMVLVERKVLIPSVFWGCTDTVGGKVMVDDGVAGAVLALRGKA